MLTHSIFKQAHEKETVLIPIVALFSCSVVSDSYDPMDCSPTRLLCPWDSLGKNTGVGCHFVLQGISPTQGSSPYLLHWQVNSLPLSHQGSPPIPITQQDNQRCRQVESPWRLHRGRPGSRAGSLNTALEQRFAQSSVSPDHPLILMPLGPAPELLIPYG